MIQKEDYNLTARTSVSSADLITVTERIRHVLIGTERKARFCLQLEAQIESSKTAKKDFSDQNGQLLPMPILYQ